MVNNVKRWTHPCRTGTTSAIRVPMSSVRSLVVHRWTGAPAVRSIAATVARVSVVAIMAAVIALLPAVAGVIVPPAPPTTVTRPLVVIRCIATRPTTPTIARLLHSLGTISIIHISAAIDVKLNNELWIRLFIHHYKSYMILLDLHQYICYGTRPGTKMQSGYYHCEVKMTFFIFFSLRSCVRQWRYLAVHRAAWFDLLSHPIRSSKELSLVLKISCDSGFPSVPRDWSSTLIFVVWSVIRFW